MLLKKPERLVCFICLVRALLITLVSAHSMAAYYQHLAFQALRRNQALNNHQSNQLVYADQMCDRNVEKEMGSQ